MDRNTIMTMAKDIHSNKSVSYSTEEKIHMFKRAIVELYGENIKDNNEIIGIFEDVLNVKYIRRGIILSWFQGEITWSQMVDIQKS